MDCSGNGKRLNLKNFFFFIFIYRLHPQKEKRKLK
uniref:Uncharacterized protein n=1 Tax=Anguilla anguilla TaxID=7936 RepID=A0A0E9PCJ7_ANGAN